MTARPWDGKTVRPERQSREHRGHKGTTNMAGLRAYDRPPGYPTPNAFHYGRIAMTTVEQRNSESGSPSARPPRLLTDVYTKSRRGAWRALAAILLALLFGMLGAGMGARTLHVFN